MRRLQRPPARGMSLVELMVGLALGLYLVAVMASIYGATKAAFNAQESVSRLQENARYAGDLLASDLRMAGFRGCPSQGGGYGNLTNALATPGAAWYAFALGIAASHSGGAGWTPALDPAVAALGPDPAGDVLTVYRPAGTAWALTAEMDDGTSALQITPTAEITHGDLLVVADCSGSALFQASNATPGTSGSIEHAAGIPGLVPGNASADLGRPWLQDATVYRVQTVTYYLAPSQRQPGLLALWSFTTPSYGLPALPSELVTGVERFVLTCGIDTVGDQAAHQFVGADAVADWTTVVSVRFDLLLVGPSDNTTTVAQPYVFAGVSTTPTDRRMRTVVSLVASLRNTAP